MGDRPSFAEAQILVVDDEPGNVALLRQTLSQAGYHNVHGVTDPRQVETLLEELRPDLILLDLMMPYLDGFGVMAMLGQKVPSTDYLPVLVLTADVAPEAKRRALTGGAKDFLTKPFDLNEVLLRIANMLEIRRLHLQLSGHNRELEERVRERTIELERALGTERQAAERLRELDEMKTTFLTAVSHEIRTPLTSVLGSAVTLEQSSTALSEQERRDLIHGLVINARRLNRILSDLLDVDRLARGIAEPRRSQTEIRALIDRIVEESELPADHPLEVDADRAIVEIDAPKVERILQNLIMNAARHTPPETPIWVNAHLQDDGLLLVVEDAGLGVPEQVRTTIFEPFRQGDEGNEHAPGVGVGLALVKRFAQLHGGSAWVEDRPGGGASFRVFLPAAFQKVGP